jgi:hypothetical protein
MDYNLNATVNETTMSGYSIKIELTRICLVCVIGAGSDCQMTPAINEEDKLILINNLVIVDEDDCDFLSEHESDDPIDAILQHLVDSGQVEMLNEDGVIKYRAISSN